MSLTGVRVTSEVWLTCVTHALSTETEEVMGLLLGDIEALEDGTVTALVWSAAPQTRSDRRRDRVETNPEQLAAASAEAERLSAATGKTTRVIGWYHSHPHITVLPSHVDVRTQGMYQMLDQGFVGLIFSCFSEDASKTGRIQATAFQCTDARKGQAGNGARPRQPWPPSAPAAEGPAQLSSSGESSGSGLQARAATPAAEEVSTSGSAAAPPSLATPPPPGPSSYAGALRKSLSNALDSPSMQEALHRSTLDQSDADYVRKEIPLRVVSTAALSASQELALAPLVSLQRILFQEEQNAYHLALLQSDSSEGQHPLEVIHHMATYQASLCKLMEYCLTPVLAALRDRHEQNLLQLAFLKDEHARLAQRAAGAREAPAAQPPHAAKARPRYTDAAQQQSAPEAVVSHVDGGLPPGAAAGTPPPPPGASYWEEGQQQQQQPALLQPLEAGGGYPATFGPGFGPRGLQAAARSMRSNGPGLGDVRSPGGGRGHSHHHRALRDREEESELQMDSPVGSYESHGRGPVSERRGKQPGAAVAEGEAKLPYYGRMDSEGDRARAEAMAAGIVGMGGPRAAAALAEERGRRGRGGVPPGALVEEAPAGAAGKGARGDAMSVDHGQPRREVFRRESSGQMGASGYRARADRDEEYL